MEPRHVITGNSGNSNGGGNNEQERIDPRQQRSLEPQQQQQTMQPQFFPQLPTMNMGGGSWGTQQQPPPPHVDPMQFMHLFNPTAQPPFHMMGNGPWNGMQMPPQGMNPQAMHPLYYTNSPITFPPPAPQPLQPPYMMPYQMAPYAQHQIPFPNMGGGLMYGQGIMGLEPRNDGGMLGQPIGHVTAVNAQQFLDPSLSHRHPKSLPTRTKPPTLTNTRERRIRKPKRLPDDMVESLGDVSDDPTLSDQDAKSPGPGNIILDIQKEVIEESPHAMAVARKSTGEGEEAKRPSSSSSSHESGNRGQHATSISTTSPTELRKDSASNSVSSSSDVVIEDEDAPQEALVSTDGGGGGAQTTLDEKPSTTSPPPETTAPEPKRARIRGRAPQLKSNSEPVSTRTLSEPAPEPPTPEKRKPKKNNNPPPDSKRSRIPPRPHVSYNTVPAAPTLTSHDNDNNNNVPAPPPLPEPVPAAAPPVPELKRARIRQRPQFTSTSASDVLAPPKVLLDYSEPVLPSSPAPFNVSEVIKDFLYVGAGYDEKGRCLTNLPTDVITTNGNEALVRSERLAWFMSHNVSYCLNMAGSPLQKELTGMTYPRKDDLNALSIDVNDLDHFDDAMRKGFDEGAAFLEKAAEAFTAYKLAHPDGTRFIPPSVFCHCVAGVNRSPFVVAWWLTRYRGFSPQDAWDLVRKRRDNGVAWKDESMGGSHAMEGHVKKAWFDALCVRDSPSNSLECTTATTQIKQ